MKVLDFLFLYPLYIDPGTGSALFSILIGAAATIYFLGRALIIKLKVVISGGRISKSAEIENQYVIYNEGRQYSSVFKPVLDEFEVRNINIIYLSSDKNDPILKESHNFVKKEFIGEENKAFLRLNMLKAQVVLMTTPGLDVYQLKRSKGVKHYAHILHAPGDAVMYRLFGIDYFDSILLTGNYQEKDIRTLETMRGLPQKRLVTVGCTYLDMASEKVKSIPKKDNHPFTVLISPSWGPSALLNRYGPKLLDPLVKTGWRIIVRPHPQSRKSENDILEKLAEHYKDTANLEWDFESDNIYSLSGSDIMISDFSGIIYDYMFLFDKPVMYVLQKFDMRPYDADDLGKNAMEELWQFKTLRETGVELKEEHFDSIAETIQKMAYSKSLKAARLEAKRTAWAYQGEAGKRVVDFMMDIVNTCSG
jgi:hypothetical protein